MRNIGKFLSQTASWPCALRARRWRPRLEDLEGRQLLSTFTVTNTNDSGTGSLRQAITASNGVTGSSINAIDFAIGSGGVETIKLKSALPAITHPVVIAGTTQPGSGTAPRIVLNGSDAGPSVVGLEVEASDTTVAGLAIDDFSSDGLDIVSASDDVITHDYIGVSAAGSAAGNGNNGLTISGNSTGNTVGGTAFARQRGLGEWRNRCLDHRQRHVGQSGAG